MFSHSRNARSCTKPRALFSVLAVGTLALTAGAANAQNDRQEMVQRMQELNQADGYLQSHRGQRNPRQLLGGPIEVSVEQNAGGVHVALPAHRDLDPTVFGPEGMPRHYSGTPGMTGVPPAFRAEAEDGGRRTGPLTPFGDKAVVMPNGRLRVRGVDATATDAATTEDEVEFEASWQDGDGNTYKVTCCIQLAAHGLEYPTFGGVVTNSIMHGWSGIGTPLMPTLYNYFAFWGMGTIYKNDEVVARPRLVHGMLTEYVRGENYRLVFDHEVTPERLHFHLMVPPFMPNAEAGHFEHVNVPTGFTLPNGNELPFWHVMFANLEIEASRQ